MSESDYRTKSEVESFLSIQIKHITDNFQWSEGSQISLHWGDSDISARIHVLMPLSVTIQFCKNNEAFNQNTVVQLCTTKCNYGGKRFWFLCPYVDHETKCSRRVGVLYLKDAVIGCRHCHQLAYRSTRKKRSRSAMAKLNELFDIDDEIHELLKSNHGYSYRNVPTKKGRRALLLTHRWQALLANLVQEFCVDKE